LRKSGHWPLGKEMLTPSSGQISEITTGGDAALKVVDDR
jgi:hypothetical protein